MLRPTGTAYVTRDVDWDGDFDEGGGSFGVRRPLRFLAHKLQLDDRQIGELARKTGRKKVTVVHKANIMKALTGIFLETAREMYEAEYRLALRNAGFDD